MATPINYYFFIKFVLGLLVVSLRAALINLGKATYVLYLASYIARLLLILLVIEIVFDGCSERETVWSSETEGDSLFDPIVLLEPKGAKYSESSFRFFLHKSKLMPTARTDTKMITNKMMIE